MRREIYCTTLPKKKAIATERKMARITVKALSVFSKSPNCKAPLELAILTSDRATVPPSNSNTSETVVDVGIPNELKISSSTTSVNMTASRIHIISEKKKCCG